MKCLILFALGLTGCASQFFVPGNRFLSPESSGGFLHGDIKTGGGGVTEVQTANDYTLSNPDTTPLLVKNSATEIGMQLGLVNHVDLYAYEAFSGPVYVGGKFQLIGDSAKDAKEGNFSISLAGAAATGSETLSQDFDNTQYQSKYNFSGYEALLLVGYRPKSWVLLYADPFYSSIKASDLITQTTSGVETTIATPNGQGDMKGASAGLRIGHYFFVNLEGSYTVTTWKRTNPSVLAAGAFSNVALGAALGGMW